MIVQTDNLYKSVKTHLQSEHDTLYVNEDQYSSIKNNLSISDLSVTTVDNVKIYGIDVICIVGLDYAILCRKGDVFPTAGDQK